MQILSRDNSNLTVESIYNILDKDEKGYITIDNVNLLLSSMNDYMVNEISNNNPLDTSFETKAKGNSEYIIQKLFYLKKNVDYIFKSDFLEYFQKNSALEALKIKIIETEGYILKKYELNITGNHIYNRLNTVCLSIKENESLIKSINDRNLLYLYFRFNGITKTFK